MPDHRRRHHLRILLLPVLLIGTPPLLACGACSGGGPTLSAVLHGCLFTGWILTGLVYDDTPPWEKGVWVIGTLFFGPVPWAWWCFQALWVLVLAWRVRLGLRARTLVETRKTAGPGCVWDGADFEHEVHRDRLRVARARRATGFHALFLTLVGLNLLAGLLVGPIGPS